MQRKGVCYDVGRVLLGEEWRPIFDPHLVHRELAIIKSDLHCTAIRICGQDISRLVAAAEDALQQGLEVWFSPELFDHSPQETLDYLLTAAEAAEQLRQQWPDRLVLSVGSELTLFMQGILSGDTFLERIGNPVTLSLTLLKLRLLRTHNKPLNAFLAKATQEVRKCFHGPLTYASAPIERVDWTHFDVIGVDYYRGKRNRTSYGERLQRYFASGKPVVITEVGCCTYQGAEEKGGRAFLIVDRKHPERLKSGYVRDESLQAREDADMLGILDTAGVAGVFMFTFVTPTMPYHVDPLYDFDKASYSLVKSCAPGQHGTTYPDMPWEPKTSFQVVAEYYANH
jgi:hypothetical protein